MSLTIAKPVMRTMVLGTGILAVKMLATNLYSFVPRIFAGFGPPEDSFIARWLGAVGWNDHLAHTGPSKSREHKEYRNTQAQESHLRAQRIVMNDLENIPLGLLCFWMAVLANPPAGPRVSRWFEVFVAARCAHSALYLSGIPGFRGAAYGAGLVATLGAIASAVRGVLGSPRCHP